MLFTGARLSEILELKWEHVDFERETLALPARKGGGRRAHPVNAAALAILAKLPREADSPWVLPAPTDASRPFLAPVLQHIWRRIRVCADIADVRIHDLRHTVGTFASHAGENAFLVRDLLRHSNVAMTSRYVNRDEDPIRAISEKVGARIAAGLAGAPAGEVVPFKRPGKG